MNIKRDADSISPVYCALLDDNSNSSKQKKRQRTHTDKQDFNVQPQKRRKLNSSING